MNELGIKMERLGSETSTQREILLNHQIFLEKPSNKDRQCNLIITGVEEAEGSADIRIKLQM